MQLTVHTDYSLRTLIYLAIQPAAAGPATVKDIAHRYGISANHVAKVVQNLVQLGYVNSTRGRGGGLLLAKEPASINIGKVVRQTENLKLLECFGSNSPCPLDPSCKLKRALAQAQETFLQTLEKYSLACLVSNEEELRLLLRTQG